MAFAQASVLPPNELDRLDFVSQMKTSSTGITEAEFNQKIAEFVSFYRPVVQIFGGDLQIEGNWSASAVNASARQKGAAWTIQVHGGLARRVEMNADAFVLVLCHELGHHLGGFPFYSNLLWSASEGQADYFATQVCVRNLWSAEKETSSRVAEELHPIALESCNASWSTQSERDLCYRTAGAALRLSRLLASFRDSSLTPPGFDRTDRSVVSRTLENHPEPQCRLDTLFQGALCRAEFDRGRIPGRNHFAGQASIEAEQEASLQSCTRSGGYETGLRPTCWFKPRF